MQGKVYIAGVGLISAIGNSVQECLQAFENHAHGVKEIVHLKTIHKGVFPAAEIPHTNDELSELAKTPSKISRTALISLIAAKEALADAKGIDISTLRSGFISANTIGGMDRSEHFFEEFYKNNKTGKLRDFVNHECGRSTELVARELNIGHFVSTISTACSSSANSLMLGARMIKNNMLDVALAGGVDALSKFTMNGFNTLMILDKEHCRPFDDTRTGLNLGEGAGYVLLVSEKIARQYPDLIYCELSGYSNANDAYHQTASSPDGLGSFLAMKNALKMSGLATKDIDYINLHGTGTQINDSSEGTAITRLFTEGVYPPMSSTKAFTGHTLGASGGIEAVLSALSIRHGILYPNLNFKFPMKDLDFVPVTKFSKGEKINNVISNSFGFGGNCSSLVFSKN